MICRLKAISSVHPLFFIIIFVILCQWHHSKLICSILWRSSSNNKNDKKKSSTSHILIFSFFCSFIEASVSRHFTSCSVCSARLDGATGEFEQTHIDELLTLRKSLRAGSWNVGTKVENLDSLSFASNLPEMSCGCEPCYLRSSNENAAIVNACWRKQATTMTNLTSNTTKQSICHQNGCTDFSFVHFLSYALHTGRKQLLSTNCSFEHKHEVWCT